MPTTEVIPSAVPEIHHSYSMLQLDKPNQSSKLMPHPLCLSLLG
jgi:hypothetical protein